MSSGGAKAGDTLTNERVVHHHVDYAAKARERQAELEALREQALTRSKGMQTWREIQQIE